MILVVFTVDKTLNPPYKVLICLGSNLGNSAIILSQAIKTLSDVLFDLRITEIIETEPIDMPLGTPVFLNCLMSARTFLLPEELIKHCLSLEHISGRVRVHNDIHENRTLDIDILDYNGIVWHSPFLDLPHTRGLNRKFVIDLLKTLNY